MTKLGITPGVHGEDVQEKKDDELTTVKVDPKVFTILQPVGAAPPVYTQPAPVREKSSACKWLALVTLIASATILTIFLGNLLMADQPMSKIFVITTSDNDVTEAPKAEAQKSVPVEVLPVKTVDGGSENTSNDQNKVIDGSVIQEPQPDQQQFNPWMAAAQARWAQQQQEANLWRWRRIQQVLYQQQMMREQWAQQQQQQQWMAEQQRAQWQARAQWEAAREQATRAEQGRAIQMRQQQWEQEQANQQQWQQYWQNQQSQQSQPQQWQQYYWNQNQEQQQQQGQEQPQFHPRLVLLRQLTRVLPIHMSVRLPEGQQTEQPTELPQPSIHDRIYQEMQKKAQGMEFNAPSRPIWTAITPTPEPATTKFDEEAAFQENLKKSLEAEAQSTTSMAPPPSAEENDEKHSDSEDGVLKDIFSALASAAQETTTAGPETSTENVFKAFSTEQDAKVDAENKANEENVAGDEDKKSSEEAAEKSGFAAFEQDGSPKVEEGEKVDEPKPTEEVNGEALPVVVFEDRFPKLEERTTTPETLEASSESSSAEVSAETSDVAPSEAGPSEPSPSEPSPSEPSPSASSEPSKEEDGSSEEHDPLAAFLKYFEQEARRMAEIRAAASSEEPVDTPEGEAAQSPTAAVDVPEANFKPASHAITV